MYGREIPHNNILGTHRKLNTLFDLGPGCGVEPEEISRQGLDTVNENPSKGGALQDRCQCRINKLIHDMPRYPCHIFVQMYDAVQVSTRIIQMITSRAFLEDPRETKFSLPRPKNKLLAGTRLWAEPPPPLPYRRLSKYPYQVVVGGGGWEVLGFRKRLLPGSLLAAVWDLFHLKGCHWLWNRLW